MKASKHKVLRYSGGITHYAEVAVECVDCASEQGIRVAADAFAWLKEDYGPKAWEWPVCDGYRRAAIKGVEYALAHTSSAIETANLDITIGRIHASPADTSDLSVALAACNATWEALRLTPSVLPRFEGREIVFPE